MIDRKSVLAGLVVLLVEPGESTGHAATLSAPVSFGSPDQAFGVRRAITTSDRALVSRYRAKTPVFSTKFASAEELTENWTFQVDDLPGLRSCRRPGTVEASIVGARFMTKVASDCRATWVTGSVLTKRTYGYGFFEASIKIADIKGMNNAFWLTTQDHYEIDVGEIQFPNYSHIGLQYWPVDKIQKHAGVGFGAHFRDDLASGFHDYGVVWTPEEMIFEVDGEPVAALATRGSVKGAATIWLSAALADWAGGPVPEHPEGHGMIVRSLRVSSP